MRTPRCVQHAAVTARIYVSPLAPPYRFVPCISNTNLEQISLLLGILLEAGVILCFLCPPL